jgi:two-component system NtrC family sensor kinase
LKNAFQAARPTGRAQVFVRRALRGIQGGVEIAVHDTGPGVPAAIQARVLEPFFSTKAPGEGTGRLGGEITLQSEPGAGATFVVWPAEDGACEA